jgi:LysR family hydrogen peroxide-inducible transcriptional activator
MELHQLRYFVAAADLKNFTRAAEKCFVAQPSLSQQIINLEKELGRPLFERLGRRVRMTDAGRSLYEQAVAILAAVDEAKRRVSGAAEPGRGKVNVGAIPTVAPYLLPPLLRQFARRFPLSEVAVHEDLTEHTVKGCLEGELDVGVVALPLADDLLNVEPLFREELLVAMPPDHRFTKKRRITLEDVGGEPFILLDDIHCLGEAILRFCTHNDCQPLVQCRSAQLLTVQELVALGQGISLIPAMACDVDRGKRCRYRSLAGTRPTRTLALIWHRLRYQSPLVVQFIEALRAYARPRANGVRSV